MPRNTTKLRSILEPTVESLGYELLHIELTNQGKAAVLRVYIDAPGGILVEDCATVSRQLSVVLDVEDTLNTAYLLEVSSPGLDRPLVKPGHFKKYIGDKAKIVTNTYILGRRNFVGYMVEADDESVVVEVDGESYVVPYTDIDSARLNPVFNI